MKITRDIQSITSDFHVTITCDIQNIICNIQNITYVILNITSDFQLMLYNMKITRDFLKTYESEKNAN